MRGADAAGGDDEVVGGGHAAGGFDDLGLVVGDDLDAFEGDAEREAEAGEVRGVGVDGLAAEDFVADYETGGGVDFALLLLGGWWWWGV